MTEQELQAKKEQIRAKRHEYYLRNREYIIQKSREYYQACGEEIREKMRVRMRETWPQRKPGRKKYYMEHRERITARGRKYYAENREKMLEYNKAYINENHEEILTKQRARAAVRKNGYKMCPAFLFLNNLRLRHIEVFTTKFKPNTDLTHKAVKGCAALQTGDYTMCPICSDCTMSDKKMSAVCPMPHVFEFENAVSGIRQYAADIVMKHQK